MKKKLLILSAVLLLVMLLAGCSGDQKYTYSIEMINPKGDNLSYGDNIISVKFEPLIKSFNPLLPPDLQGINIDIKNNTDDSISVLWDSVSFVDIDNSALQVMHNAPNIIPPEAKISDTIIPINHANWSIEDNWDGSGDHITKYIGIFIPVRVGNEIKDYNFKFEITVSKPLTP